MRCDNAGEKSKVAEDNIIPTGPPVDGNALIQQEILKEYEEKEARRRQNNPTRVNATMQKIYSDIARAELEPPMPEDGRVVFMAAQKCATIQVIL